MDRAAPAVPVGRIRSPALYCQADCLELDTPLVRAYGSRQISQLALVRLNVENARLGHFFLRRLLHMAKLRAAARNALPKSSFGLPGSRKYPMPDRAHAANAKARAAQQAAKGNLSEGAKESIDAKADRKFNFHDHPGN